MGDRPARDRGGGTDDPPRARLERNGDRSEEGRARDSSARGRYVTDGGESMTADAEESDAESADEDGADESAESEAEADAESDSPESADESEGADEDDGSTESEGGESDDLTEEAEESTVSEEAEEGSEDAEDEEPSESDAEGAEDEEEAEGEDEEEAEGEDEAEDEEEAEGEDEAESDGDAEEEEESMPEEDEDLEGVHAGGAEAVYEDDDATGVLHLDLDGLALDLLGLEVHLDDVVLDVSARSGDNNLLGNLLSTVTGLLDGLATSPLEAAKNALGGLKDRLSSMLPGSPIAWLREKMPSPIAWLRERLPSPFESAEAPEDEEEAEEEAEADEETAEADEEADEEGDETGGIISSIASLPRRMIAGLVGRLPLEDVIARAVRAMIQGLVESASEAAGDGERAEGDQADGQQAEAQS